MQILLTVITPHIGPAGKSLNRKENWAAQWDRLWRSYGARPHVQCAGKRHSRRAGRCQATDAQAWYDARTPVLAHNDAAVARMGLLIASLQKRATLAGDPRKALEKVPHGAASRSVSACKNQCTIQT